VLPDRILGFLQESGKQLVQRQTVAPQVSKSEPSAPSL
jgi:hypothetical protein